MLTIGTNQKQNQLLVKVYEAEASFNEPTKNLTSALSLGHGHGLGANNQEFVNLSFVV